MQPDVLLMDEPCSALDPISTLAIEDLIAELKQDYTIVIVTHNMQQAARVSDQTAFFNLEATGKPGRLVEIDDTEKIFSNPTQKATEDYISGRFGWVGPTPSASLRRATDQAVTVTSSSVSNRRTRCSMSSRIGRTASTLWPAGSGSSHSS